MEIRKANLSDLADVTEIYAKARRFMAENGNPRQWGMNNYPPTELTESDIISGRLYVCTEDGRSVGVFFYDYGDNAEPLYSKFDGAVILPYGVVHRIASDGTVKGVGRYCLSWAIKQSGRLMIDTHTDNKVMQGLLSSLGFTYLGDINIPDDEDIRMVYMINSLNS